MRTKLALTLKLSALLVLLGLGLLPVTGQQNEVIPHGQSRPPGPPLSPAEALKKMQVPPGFTVELVASEPDIVNPVAMTFDEKGRIWITESLEYPRRSPGPGKDRVKILEDTDGDGKADRFTVFAEGLNIPSGIAIGNGGVYVANAPDILFYRIGPDGKAAGKPQVVVTGFGRTDVHEVPNSLTWGPDGWLYGLNGVFNQSHVKHQGKEWRFNCALFRIHPKTNEFELFCEGTSNPWGLAIDSEGSFFVSVCVIDHLWHLTETGYYHRQAGPYPPWTWKLGSIVKHKHQKAAYCGLHYFDSDAYPPEYREQLYMGNIHGGCINRDVLTRDGATYFARPRPDFLTANDPWFMPVVQKTGPDGCLYILDWYDRYHCYQDANRDPAGIDRLYGRLWRVRYKDTPRAAKFDLAQETDEQLIQRLHSPNVFFRDMAQRLLWERNNPATNARLEQLVLDDNAPRKARLHALWALIGTGQLNAAFHQRLLQHRDPTFRAWGVRAAGNFKKIEPALRDQVVALAADPAADVQLQVAIAARKIAGLDPVPLLTRVLALCGDDTLVPPIVWQNLHPLLEERGDHFLQLYREAKPEEARNLAVIMPRVVERILGSKKSDPNVIVTLFGVLAEGKNANPKAAQQCLGMLATKVQTGELAGEQLAMLRHRLQPVIRRFSSASDNPLALDAALLAATLKDPAGFDVARQVLTAADQPEATRLRALEALIAGGDPSLLGVVEALLADTAKTTAAFRGQALQALGRLDDPKVSTVVLAHYPRMEKDVQPRAIELLTQRVPWSKQLLQAIGEKKLPPEALNVNQVRRLLASKDAQLIEQVRKFWGTLREERNPEREKVVAQMRELLKKVPGDPVRGIAVWKNLCAQCHKLHGEGQDVGPDITHNGRSDFEQLLSNVFDPSLVIGAAYQATMVLTKKGQVITGLVVEDNAQRVVLKVQGGKLETVPQGDIEEISVSKLSMMPENLEQQLKPQEIADLFAYLCLDKPPSDPTARRIPGTPNPPR
ncbi:MAG: c-type cytochrome [Gemmataceae bacterium]|nr:c-type cytochrome [Gemmataceae bacterium]MDW8266378.1 c-type cytochrome [Gemmataceae bacterium]